MSNKPHTNDFFIRGVPLHIALDAIAKWETLTDKEKEVLGFSAQHLQQMLVLPDLACSHYH